jgi:magnesium transporter
MAATNNLPLSIIHYDRNSHSFRFGSTLSECAACRDEEGVTWINVDTVSNADILKSLGEAYGLHDLTIQDIANTEHRVKYEDFNHYVLIIMKMLEYNAETQSVDAEQLSIVLGDNFLLTFQEKPGDFFGGLRNEIKIADSIVRKMGPDYLACRIIDIIVDNYFGTVERFGNEIEDKEDELVTNPTRTVLYSIQGTKKNMMQLRQYVWPAREILSDLGKKESSLIKDETTAYFRDVYDRLFEAMDLIETTREMVSGLIDIYLSSMSNKTNDVMKVLTVVATIFIPLTFIVGLYGMNFKYMPELESPWGYPAIITFMLVVALGMLAYFRKKKWI